METTDAQHMRMAIAASRAAMAAGNMPYGAVLVSPAGETLFTAQNNQRTSSDCTGHAETALVREAAAALGAEVAGGDLLPIGYAAVLAGSTPPVAVEGPLLQDEAVAVLREFAARAT